MGRIGGRNSPVGAEGHSRNRSASSNADGGHESVASIHSSSPSVPPSTSPAGLISPRQAAATPLTGSRSPFATGEGVVSPDELAVLAASGVAYTDKYSKANASPLMAAAAVSNVRAIVQLLAQQADLHYRDRQGASVFHWVCQEPSKDSPRCLQALLDAAADQRKEILFFQDSDFGWSCIHRLAASQAHASSNTECAPLSTMMRTLLTSLSSPLREQLGNMQDKNGRTAMHFTAGRGCLECCQALLRCGATASLELQEHKYHSTPLQIAEQRLANLGKSYAPCVNFLKRHCPSDRRKAVSPESPAQPR
eukprot:NODE_1489_length_1398_cov_3.210526_g1237_i0.p1 GENE.NODE_1489_length_1398_cov_3.210526_g1237_i0~~NODE_1489_length_1398_cov_3.210526_g1237_i0.p1  ORF type:complete len:308 (-),score=36.52 NODE_1489_length_1398_cov_3.210526_g1237_i0:473-1396(-)